MVAQEEKFSTTVGKNINSMLPANRFRHLTLDGRSNRKLVKSVDISGVRSLTVFNEPSESIASLRINCFTYLLLSNEAIESFRFLKCQISYYSARYTAHRRIVPFKIL